MIPAQKKYPVRRFVLFGPESTGKSTLCRQLADYFNEPCNPEFMRTYLQEKWDKYQKTCEPEDILPIAEGQMKNENRLAAQAKKFLFSDTNLLELVVYSEVYYGKAGPELKEAALNNHYDLYFLTYIDVPWEPDDLRDKPHEREEMFSRFEKILIDNHLPYVILRGNKEERLKKAIKIIRMMEKNNLKFTREDMQQLREKGLTAEDILNQLNYLRQGTQFRKLDRPATIGDGIVRLSSKDEKTYQSVFKNSKQEILRFVPASGAATRMFKDLFVILKEAESGNRNWHLILEKNQLNKLKNWDDILPKLAFHPDVLDKMKKQIPGYEQLPEDEKKLTYISFLLKETGMNYANTPKALIPFHRYNSGTRMAFEEHIFDARQTLASQKAQVHFTVSPEKEKLFRKEYEKIRHAYPEVEIDFSFQLPSTDTIMVNLQNEVVRDEQGKFVFRPGGHGSLLQNLNHIDAPFVFVKNIDNVQKEPYKSEGLKYFQILSGMMLHLTGERNRLIKFLKEEKPGKKELHEAENFLRKFQDKFIAGYEHLPASQRREYLEYKLNRPMRVVGMVKNSGQPGGGPFWITDKYGNVTLQIVEKSEINLSDPVQKEIFLKATHFNPVFMILGLRDYAGTPYPLNDFVNPEAGFVSEKMHLGQRVKIYEHPGLWNGSMEYWLSLFVEVPPEVFSPVKEFYDLSEIPHV